MSVPLQLEKVRAQAQQSQRNEAAAKAVLAAAKDAARQGRALSAEERSSVERPILYPEQAQKQTPPPQVCSTLLTARIQAYSDCAVVDVCCNRLRSHIVDRYTGRLSHQSAPCRAG